MPTLRVPLLCLIALGVAVACCDLPIGAAEEKSKKDVVKGKFLFFDAERNLLRASQGRISVTLLVDKETKLLVDGSPTTMKLADLPERSYLNLTLNADKTTVLAINAIGPNLKWTIDTVDPAKRTVSVYSGKKKDTYTVLKHATITNVNKETVTLEEVKPGSVAYLQLSLDKTRVLGLSIRSAD